MKFDILTHRSWYECMNGNNKLTIKRKHVIHIAGRKIGYRERCVLLSSCWMYIVHTIIYTRIWAIICGCRILIENVANGHANFHWHLVKNHKSFVATHAAPQHAIWLSSPRYVCNTSACSGCPMHVETAGRVEERGNLLRPANEKLCMHTYIETVIYVYIYICILGKKSY